MDKLNIALLCIIALMAAAVCASTYTVLVDKSTPSSEGDDPVEEFSFVDTWEWRVGYYVTSTDMNTVETAKERDSLTFTNQYGKLIQILEGDKVHLAIMTNDVTAICLQNGNNVEVDNYYYAATDNLVFRYVNAWDDTDNEILAGVSAYVRQGTTVSDSEIEKYLTCPDICDTYVMDHIECTMDFSSIVSKTTTINDLGHGLISLTETLTDESGKTTEARSIGFFTPTNKLGDTWGAYTRIPGDVSEDTFSSSEFICNENYFSTTSSIYTDNGPETSFFSSMKPVDVPELEGITLTCIDGTVELGRDYVERNFTSEFSIHITMQDGYCFKGYATNEGEKVFDFTGLVSTISGNNIMLEYEYTNTSGILCYYVYIGNFEDGFNGAGGNSYLEYGEIRSSSLIVTSNN